MCDVQEHMFMTVRMTRMSNKKIRRVITRRKTIRTKMKREMNLMRHFDAQV
jgi:hypothetical protein